MSVVDAERDGPEQARGRDDRGRDHGGMEAERERGGALDRRSRRALRGTLGTGRGRPAAGARLTRSRRPAGAKLVQEKT